MPRSMSGMSESASIPKAASVTKNALHSATMSALSSSPPELTPPKIAGTGRRLLAFAGWEQREGGDHGRRTRRLAVHRDRGRQISPQVSCHPIQEINGCASQDWRDPVDEKAEPAQLSAAKPGSPLPS